MLIVRAKAIQDTQAGIRHDLEGYIPTSGCQRVGTLNSRQGLIIGAEEH